MTRSQTSQLLDVLDMLIIGRGLVGLTIATYIAGADWSVKLYGNGSHLGGRAATRTKNYLYFNLDPHPLYRSLGGKKVLQQLGTHFSGRKHALASGFPLMCNRPQPSPLGSPG